MHCIRPFFSRCSISRSIHIVSDEVETIKIPRYPIVLCHGLFGCDKYGPETMPKLQIHYWGSIAQKLQEHGCHVVITKVSPCASISTRAMELGDRIEKTLSGQYVNLITHSMGGLDARYMIRHLMTKYNFQVKGLTTVSTPHHGSSIADWLHEQILRRRSFDRCLRLLGIDPVVLHNLSTHFVTKEFNPSTPNHPDVAYFSYGAQIDIPAWSPWFVPYSFLSQLEGPNDGLVSVQSAQWGTYLGTVQAAHWNLLDRWNPQSGSFNAIKFYLGIVRMLHDRGF
jgi:pimeloyl-ACP methyl ester carboxylesterase